MQEPRSTAALRLASTALLSIVGLAFVILMCVGVIRFWHPLPHWDMWGGYVAFWLRLSDGDWSTWWELHNEHRIVLTRLAFWLDFSVFKGSGWILIALNTLLAITIGATLIAALRLRLLESRQSLRPQIGFFVLAVVITALTTSWLQYENLTWGFQVQFFLAVLIPLLALLAISRASGDSPTVNRWLSLGLVLSALSMGTIASGVLVPWLAAGLIAWRRLPRRWLALFLLFATAATVFYAIGFKPTWNGSNPVQSLQHDPVGVLAFLLAFLGSPWSLGQDPPVLAIAAGAVYLLIVVGYLIRQLRRRSVPSVGLALLVFAVFIIAWGFITATGRLRYGLDYAVISRYTTPVLAGWAGLMCLAAPRFQQMLTARKYWIAIVPAAAIVLLSGPQAQALGSNATWMDSRNWTALALSLGIPDRQAMYVHVWAPKYAIRLTDRLRTDGTTLFGEPPLNNLQRDLGTPAAGVAEIPCTSEIERVDGIELSDWRRVSGTVLPATSLGEDYGLVRILGPSRTIVGYATMLRDEDDVPNNEKAQRFIGYLASGANTDGLTLADQRWVCTPSLRIK